MDAATDQARITQPPPHARPAALETTGVQRGSWPLLFMLTLVYIVSFIDRGALSLVIGPIKQDLGASDLEVSWLLGLSFMLLYSVLGIPAGYLVDLYQRKRLLGGAILMWSGVQMLSGFSATYWHLFAARMGLGVGEAMLPPAASSMIRDAFPPERRSLAFGIYNMGPMLGSAGALILGGYMLNLAASGQLDALPLLGGLKPWQIVLIVPGLLGLPIVLLLMLVVREPARRDIGGPGTKVSFKDACRFAWEQRGVYAPLWLAISLYGIAIGSQMAWLPEIVHRATGIARPSIGQTLGSVSLVAAPLGLLIWGSLADRLQRRGHVDAPLRVAMACTAVAALITAAFPWITNPLVGAAAYGAQTFFFVIFAVAGGATMANFTPGAMMGKLTALYYLCTNLLGLALGPSVVALVAKLFFFDGPEALGHAFVICYVIAVALAVALLSRVARRLRANARS